MAGYWMVWVVGAGLALTAACSHTETTKHASSSRDEGGEVVAVAPPPPQEAAVVVFVPVDAPKPPLDEEIHEEGDVAPANEGAGHSEQASAAASSSAAAPAVRPARAKAQKADDASGAASAEPTRQQEMAAENTAPRQASAESRPKAPPSNAGKPRPAPSIAISDLTAMDQGDSAEDLATTRRIRRAIVDHEQSSFWGRNVTIVTRNGQVALLGQVQTDEQRKLIEQIARRNAGAASVQSRLQVAAND